MKLSKQLFVLLLTLAFSTQATIFASMNPIPPELEPLSLDLLYPRNEPQFISAARRGDLETVQDLLDDQPSVVNITDDNGYTALLRASENGFSQIVTVLIAAGADVNAVDNIVHDTALVRAVLANNSEIVLAILTSQAFNPVAHNQAREAYACALNRGREYIAALIRPYLQA